MAHFHRFPSIVAFIVCAPLSLLSPAWPQESGGEPTSSPARECIPVPDLVDCGASFRREPRQPLPPECAALRRSLTPGDLTRTAERVRMGALVVLAIGSSSTSGVGASSPDAAYPARLEHELKQFVPGLDVTGRGVGCRGRDGGSETLARLVGQIASVEAASGDLAGGHQRRALRGRRGSVPFAGRTRRRGGGQLRRRPGFAEPAVLSRASPRRSAMSASSTSFVRSGCGSTHPSSAATNS